MVERDERGERVEPGHGVGTMRVTRGRHDEVGAGVELEHGGVEHQVVVAGVARVALVEVLHVSLPGAVGLGRQLAGLLLVDALEAHRPLHPSLERPVEAHVQRTRVVAQHDGRGSAQDHAAVGPGDLLQDPLGLLAERHLGLVAERRPRRGGHRPELGVGQRGSPGQAGEQAAEPRRPSLVVRHHVLHRDRERLGHRDRDGAVEELQVELLRDRRSDDAPPGSERRRQRDDRCH